VIGVKKTGNEYVGFIIKADGVYWTQGQVKFRIKEKDGRLLATYYLLDHAHQEFNEVALIRHHYLHICFIWLNLVKFYARFKYRERIAFHVWK
jgi:hypothetical protein